MKTFFEAHIWTLRGKLYRMAYLWVKEKEIANDLLQSVFEKAWKRREALQKMDNPTGWMVSCLKNECFQHFKASKRFERLNEEEWEEEVLEGEETDEKVRLVFQFLETLPEKQREIFQLREVEGLMYEEIGEYLEISLEQVKVNLYRARKTLREFLMQKKNER